MKVINLELLFENEPGVAEKIYLINETDGLKYGPFNKSNYALREALDVYPNVPVKLGLDSTSLEPYYGYFRRVGSVVGQPGVFIDRQGDPVPFDKAYSFEHAHELVNIAARAFRRHAAVVVMHIQYIEFRNLPRKGTPLETDYDVHVPQG